MKLLALIFAYLISHVIAKPQRLRNFEWFKSWSIWLDKHFRISNKEVAVITMVAVPVFVISFILLALFNSILGLLLVSILVLSYCIGPQSLEEEVESGKIRQKLGIRKNAIISVLIKKMTQISLQRWFGVFFWYVLLGIVGALMYRLSERLDFFTKNDDSKKATTTKLMKILNYPVAWMMVISLAVASDFERIFKKCKPFMSFENISNMDDSFLYDAADFAVENCEIEEGNKQSIEQVTVNVLKRMLVVWLVFVSILVILAI